MQCRKVQMNPWLSFSIPFAVLPCQQEEQSTPQITDLTHTSTQDTSTPLTRTGQCGTTRSPSMAKVRGEKINPQAKKHFLLIFSFLLNHRISQATCPFGKWRPSKPLLFFPSQQCTKFHLLVWHLKMFLKDSFVFLGKRKIYILK